MGERRYFQIGIRNDDEGDWEEFQELIKQDPRFATKKRNKKDGFVSKAIMFLAKSYIKKRRSELLNAQPNKVDDMQEDSSRDETSA